MSVNYNTAREALDRNIVTMGPDLGPVYHRLWNEVAWLHVKWDQYVNLFGSKPERIDLPNGAAVITGIPPTTTGIHVRPTWGRTRGTAAVLP